MKHLIGIVLLVLASSSAGATHNLVGATVHTVSGPVIEDAVVSIGHDGTITYVGPRDAAPQADGATDLSGMHLYPGLIAASSSLGLTEISAVQPGNDHSEIGDFNARLHAYRSVNPDSELLPVARGGGLTHVLVVPGGGIVRGQSGLLRTEGWTWEERLEKGPAGLHLNWPSMSLDRSDDAKPMKKQAEERRARIASLSEWVAEARTYGAASDRPRNLELEAWQSVLRGEIPLFVHANDARQVRAAIEWGSEHGLRIVIVGGRDAYLEAERLAEAEVSVVLENIMSRPARDYERVDAGYRRAAVLNEAGVKIALSVGSGPWPDSLARNLSLHAAMAHAHGLPGDAAVRSITLDAAAILGVDDRLGSIEVGKQASLIALGGELLEITEPVRRMWIAGREVDLANRHTRLFERYRARP